MLTYLINIMNSHSPMYAILFCVWLDLDMECWTRIVGARLPIRYFLPYFLAHRGFCASYIKAYNEVKLTRLATGCIIIGKFLSMQQCLVLTLQGAISYHDLMVSRNMVSSSYFGYNSEFPSSIFPSC